MKHVIPALCLFSLIFPATVDAQFHQKSSTGQTATRQMNNPYGSTTPSVGGFQMPGSPVNRKIEGTNLRVVGISPGAQKMAKNMVSEKTGNHVKIDFSTMSFKDPDVWGRAENHTDGTYTETIFDYENKQADNLVVQETRRKSMTGDDPLLLTRKIILNQMGAPEEVMIFDGSGRYKYHGKFIYDSMGRMVEEQLRDASGQPLRRTVQEYTATGEHLPLKTWDYVSSVPSDLRLVVTNSEEMYRDQLQEMNRQLEDAEGKGLFANRKKRKIEEKAREMQEQFSQRNAAPTQAPEIPEATATAAKEESGGKRFRLFGKRK